MWGEVDPAELQQVWADELGRFSGDDLREAVAGVVAAYPEYPPTLPQFIGLCMDAKRKRAQESVKLPGPKTEMPAHIREQLRSFVNKARA